MGSIGHASPRRIWMPSTRLPPVARRTSPWERDERGRDERGEGKASRGGGGGDGGFGLLGGSRRGYAAVTPRLRRGYCSAARLESRSGYAAAP